MTLSAGTRLGPYEILAPIGVGGMGEVYRARDTRLGRDVAIKLLPPEFASARSRRERFEREARAVAALNHPNILALHDIGNEDGVLYMITELVDGETLREVALTPRSISRSRRRSPTDSPPHTPRESPIAI
jgi:eukaryotic-like serine/threonine-protein kinase